MNPEVLLDAQAVEKPTLEILATAMGKVSLSY